MNTNTQLTNFLCSYPRSGSTYLRFLIDKNTNFCLGTLYPENPLDAACTTDSRTGKKLIASKTHYPTQYFNGNYFHERNRNYLNHRTNLPDNKDNVSLLILIRNPYDTLISQYKRKKRVHTTAQFTRYNEPPFQLNPLTINRFCCDWNDWISYYENVKCYRKKFITYEELYSNTKKVLKEVCDYFEINLNSDFENVSREESIDRTRKINPAFSSRHIGECKKENKIQDIFSESQINQMSTLCEKNIKQYFNLENS
jgi:hypothetical protein